MLNYRPLGPTGKAEPQENTNPVAVLAEYGFSDVKTENFVSVRQLADKLNLTQARVSEIVAKEFKAPHFYGKIDGKRVKGYYYQV